MSVDQVGADVGTSNASLQPIKERSVRRSGWCRRRHHVKAGRGKLYSQCPSIRLVPTSAPDGQIPNPATPGCPSIRLVPTSAPASATTRSGRDWVSVDQVGADVGTVILDVALVRLARCPSIRLVPTSAPTRRSIPSRSSPSVRRSGWCRRRHRGYRRSALCRFPSVRRSGWCRRRHLEAVDDALEFF